METTCTFNFYHVLKLDVYIYTSILEGACKYKVTKEPMLYKKEFLSILHYHSPMPVEKNISRGLGLKCEAAVTCLVVELGNEIGKLHVMGGGIGSFEETKQVLEEMDVTSYS